MAVPSHGWLHHAGRVAFAATGEPGRGMKKSPRMGAQPGDSKERRKDLRIDVSFPIIVALSTNGERMPAVVENVSLSGVLLRSDNSLPLQSRVDLEITFEDQEPLRIPAVVIRSTGVQSYGTMFVELSDEDADRLMDLTAQCLKTAAPAPWFLG
jgi:hypothetical protein